MEHKSRGLKHIKDKRKYKGNSRKNPKHVPPKNKPQLGSNWDRYEMPDENEYEPQLSSSTDFALLANVPISTGSHFHFKNDKISEDDKIKSNLFSLNLDILQKSILTVPFYERLDISKDYFNDLEIDHMDKMAATNLESFQMYVKHMHDTDVNNVNSEDPPQNPTCCPEKDNEAENCENVTGNSTHKDDDILELIENCSINEVENDVTVAMDKDSNKHDLEQWLDDILED